MLPTDAVGESGGRETELTVEELWSSDGVVEKEDVAEGELGVRMGTWIGGNSGKGSGAALLPPASGSPP